MLQWIRKIFSTGSTDKSDFELAFSELQDLSKFTFYGPNRTYELLSKLNELSSNKETDELIEELKKISYTSNTTNVFYFYFPIVSHILFYKPAYEQEILGMIIGPNFANGETEVDGMMKGFQGAMDFKLKENPKYLTPESQFWIKYTLPKMEQEVKREIEICWKKLNE